MEGVAQEMRALQDAFRKGHIGGEAFHRSWKALEEHQDRYEKESRQRPDIRFEDPAPRNRPYHNPLREDVL